MRTVQSHQDPGINGYLFLERKNEKENNGDQCFPAPVRETVVNYRTGTGDTGVDITE